MHDAVDRPLETGQCSAGKNAAGFPAGGRRYRHRGIRLWHECKDVDLALWIDDQSPLGSLRRAMAVALRKEREIRPDFGVADHQVDTFLFEPGTDTYLGRLCHFNACPRARPECAVPACGDTPFNRVFPDFRVHSDILADVGGAILFRRSDSSRETGTEAALLAASGNAAGLAFSHER